MENKKPLCGIIYVHKNKLNGKCYVGLSANKKLVKKRWANGEGYSRQKKFYNAIKKYGWDNFEHIILPTIYETMEALNQAEIDMIAELDSYNSGYNSNIGGGSMIGYITSEETKIKQSKAQKGRTISEEAKVKISKAHKGKKLSEEHKDKISKGLEGKLKDRQFSEDHRKKLSEAAKKRAYEKRGPLSQEVKDKISTSRSGKVPWNKGLKTGPLSDEHKLKMSESIKGKVLSQETKDKMRESKLGTIPWNKGKYLSAEHIARVVETKRLNKLEKEEKEELKAQ